MKRTSIALMIAQSMLMRMPLTFGSVVPNERNKKYGVVSSSRNGSKPTFKRNRRHQMKYGFKAKCRK